MDCTQNITVAAERKKGQHLQREERGAIQHLKLQGLSNRAIARELGCSPTTVGNELRRGTPPRKSDRGTETPGYSAKRGEAVYMANGACCAVIDGEFYKRYDAKRGKKVPAGAIPCEDVPDPVTGHLPCWVKCERQEPGDKWFWAAYDNYLDEKADGTYEALGPHFQMNPYHLEQDILKPHGEDIIEVERSFKGIREYLENNYIEGIVFWKDGEPKCKIKRKDFGFPWKTDTR